MFKTITQISTWIIAFTVAWFIGYTYNLNHSLEFSWVMSIYNQKIALLHQAKNSPRLLIIGGSGTHMGIDALLIEQNVGIPVYNLGLHAALGLNAIMSSITGETLPNDIILLIPEYEILGDKDGVARLAVPFGIATNRLGLMDLSWEELSREILDVGNPSLRNLSRSLMNWLQKRTKSDYYSEQVDSRGSPVELKIRKPAPKIINENISEYAQNRLKLFRDTLKSTNNPLILSLPWTLSTVDEQSLENVRLITSALSEIAPVVYDETYNLKTDSLLFGDTNYHLSYQGRKIRSLNLATELKPLIVDLIPLKPIWLNLPPTF